MSSAASSSRPVGDAAKEAEVERIIKSFKLNPYDILDLPSTATDVDIKKQYRKKSLLIHPDKFKHEKGPDAFDTLQKAQAVLSDPSKRAEVDSVVTHARILVLRTNLPLVNPSTVNDDDPRLKNLNPPFETQIRNEAKKVFIEEEVTKRRAQKLSYANEGAEAAKKEAEREARKRKAEEAVKWEERRDDRVNNWRDFATAPKKKKTKKNAHVLG